MPQTGQVRLWDYPLRPSIRMDHGIQTGQQVSPFYDPMMAKVIAHGDTRAEAIRRLASAVQDTRLLGINNNKLFLQNILRHEVFTGGEATTAFIEQHFAHDVSMVQKQPSSATLSKAAMLYFQRGVLSSKGQAGHDGHFDWGRASARSYVYKIEFVGNARVVNLTESKQHFEISVGDEKSSLTFCSMDENCCVYIENRVRETLSYVFDHHTMYLDDGSGHFILEDVTHRPAAAASGVGSGQAKASMDGAIVEVLVNEGDSVDAGQTLVVLEAMKMEHAIKAGIGGTVTAINCKAGDQVKSKQILATLEGTSSDE